MQSLRKMLKLSVFGSRVNQRVSSIRGLLRLLIVACFAVLASAAVESSDSESSAGSLPPLPPLPGRYWICNGLFGQGYETSDSSEDVEHVNRRVPVGQACPFVVGRDS